MRETLVTPIGTLVVISDEMGQLRAADWADYGDRMRRLLTRHYGEGAFTLTFASRLSEAATAIAAYFHGDLHAIDALPTATAGTPFQKRVWEALREIPTGRTWSYGDLAKRIGQPTAVRAVGLANGANPIGIVVPCHRVIGADGSLTGYGGGLERKRWLLHHERSHAGLCGSVAMEAIAAGHTMGLSI
jgi:methylated-DNA-[protein]-cysteine S-methyltransferase